MAIKLEKVVPIGRSLAEYRAMFGLSDDDLNQKIIGAGDGPASFNAELFSIGHSVVSVDPLYVFPADEIEQQFYAVVDNIIAQIKATPLDWVWNFHQSPDDLRKNRVDILHRFLADYEQGKAQGRYVLGELPQLKFHNKQFQLVLCSHFLFLYSEQLTYEFHRASVLEMLRIAGEVRIFPLLTLALRRSPYIAPLIEELTSQGFKVSVERMGYELQKGVNEMLRIQQAV